LFIDRIPGLQFILEILGAVDFELINILPQFHGFMKNGPDGQVKEPFLPMERVCRRKPKNGMAVLFEQIEETIPSIIDPVFNIREMKLVSLVFFEDFLKGNLGQEEPPNHFQYLSVPKPLGFSLHVHLFLYLNITSPAVFVKSKSYEPSDRNHAGPVSGRGSSKKG